MAGFLAKEMSGIGRYLLLSAVGMLIVSCGSNRQVDVPAGESKDLSPGIEETVAGESELEVHRGTLTKTVEEGGWLVRTPGREYLLLSTSAYRREPWFREGTSVEVQGREVTDVMTIYMQGTPFRVSAMKPLSPAGQQQE